MKKFIKRLFLIAPLFLTIPFMALSCSNKFKVGADINKGKAISKTLGDEVKQDGILGDFDSFPSGFGTTVKYLSHAKYNSIYKLLKDDEVGIITIANNKIYKEFIETDGNKSLEQLMNSEKNISYKWKHVIKLGGFIQTFKYNNSDWLHGTINQKNYNEYYPLFFYKHIFSTLGASSLLPTKKSIIEISYDKYDI